MKPSDNASIGPTETRAARREMQAQLGTVAWAEHQQAEPARDERTARLPALRLERDAATKTR